MLLKPSFLSAYVSFRSCFQKSTHFPAQTRPLHIFSRFRFLVEQESCPLGLEGKHLYLSLGGFFPQLLSENTVYDEPRDGDSHKN